MPKRKTKNLDPIDELIEEIQDAESTIVEDNTSQVDDTTQIGVDKKRNELTKLAEDGELDKSVAYIKKASNKVIDKLYVEYECKRMQKANEFLTDLLISKFSSTLGGLNAIENPEELTNELKKDELLKRDVYCIVEKVSPYLPLIGILSGGITVGKHVYHHVAKTPEPNEEDGYDTAL